MMSQIVDMFRLQAEEKGLNFQYTPKSGLPDLVQGDEKRPDLLKDPGAFLKGLLLSGQRPG